MLFPALLRRWMLALSLVVTWHPVSSLLPLIGVICVICGFNLPRTAGYEDLLMRELEQRVAVITGAAMGIGRALATRLADEGARLCLADINKEELDVVAHDLTAKGCDVSAYAVDVADERQVEVYTLMVSSRNDDEFCQSLRRGAAGPAHALALAGFAQTRSTTSRFRCAAVCPHPRRVRLPLGVGKSNTMVGRDSRSRCIARDRILLRDRHSACPSRRTLLSLP